MYKEPGRCRGEWWVEERAGRAEGFDSVANENRSDGNAGNATLLTVLIVVAVLYFARTVFIPLALSILLTFMLALLVIRLRHWGLGRIPSESRSFHRAKAAVLMRWSRLRLTSARQARGPWSV